MTDSDEPATDQTAPSEGTGDTPTGSRRILAGTVRAWLGPPTVKGFDDPKAFEKQHDEVSMTLRRVMFAIVTYSAFCLVTLFDPDFLLTEGKIKIPFVDSPIRAIDFFYFGPLVLIAIALYMHIFVGYWQAMSGAAPKSLPFIFNMDTPVTRLLTAFLFYWLVPLMLLYFFWSAQPFEDKFPDLLPYLQFLVLTVALVFVSLGIRRRPLDKRSVIWNVGIWGLLVGVGGSGVFAAAQLTLGLSIPIPQLAGTEQQMASTVPGAPPATPPAAPPEAARAPATEMAAPVLDSPEAAEQPVPMPPTPRPEIAQQVTQTALGVVLNRGLRLEGKDLRDVDLRNFNLVNANLARSNLGGIDLSARRLMGADLNGADLTGANLVRANLQQADLTRAYLVRANLASAILAVTILDFADLKGADLSKATLQDAHLNGANLEGTNLVGADLIGADLRGAQGLRCEQLKRARNWEKSFRDDTLACDAPIPPYPAK